MVDKKKVILAISCGDINGVGIEIIIKLFLNKDMFDFCVPILYAPKTVVDDYMIMYQEFSCFVYHLINSPEHAKKDTFNVIDFIGKSINITPGVPTKDGAEIAIQSLDLAFQHLKKHAVNVLLTLPVNKQNISKTLKCFVGHTEYLSKNTNSHNSLMILCSQNLRIATLTNHLPIHKLADNIKKNTLTQKLNILIESLKIDFDISNPKIAVLGFNPHAGDSSLIGDEESSIISPVVYEFIEAGHFISGPYSADGFFGSGLYKKFDAILGMYHDQALIPFKLLSFGSGVNYTAGLPVIRVSPDHGVAYDIAGKNIAKENSVKSAVLLGVELYKKRKIYFDCNRKIQTTY